MCGVNDEWVPSVPEDEPTKEELEAIAEAKADTSLTVSHESIDGD